MSNDHFTDEFLNSQQPSSSKAGQRPISIKEAVDWFFEDQLARGLQPGSIQSQRYHIDPIAENEYGLGPDIHVAEVTRLDVVGYIQRRFDPDITGRIYTTSGRINAIRQLKSFFRWVYERGLSESFILQGLKPPRRDQKRIVPLTDLEITKVYEAIHSRGRLRIRNASIFSLLLDTGMRRSELVRLRKSDLNLDARTAKVFGKKKERIVGFGVRTAELLWLYAGHSRSTRPGNNKDHLFLHRAGTDLSAACVTGLFNQLKVPTGIKRLNAHITRHTFATRFLQRGGDPFTLRILLGHSSLRMVATYVATAEATNPDIMKDHSIVDETKAIGQILANYTKSSVVRRTLTGKESRKHHKTSTLFMPTFGGDL